MKQVWVISDKKAGHYNQSLAVAHTIKTLLPSEVTVVEVKVKKYAKYLLRMLLNTRLGRALIASKMHPGMIAWFYEGALPSGKPDVVVSSGKDTSMLTALLGLMYGAKSLFIGNPKKLDHRLFSAVLTVLDLGFENQVLLDVAPTLPYEGDLEAFCKAHHLDPNATYYTLLIGGDGAGYRYSDAEYEALIDCVNSAPKGVSWLVTTSRRTPLAMEKRMQEQMRTAMFVAYNQAPQKVMGPFLALGDKVFVTEESASMVSEAVASGKPVVTLRPSVCEREEDYARILKKFQESRAIYSQEIACCNTKEIDTQRLEQKDFSEVLKQKLGMILTEENG